MVQYKGETFTGGDMIVGVAQAGIVDCITAPEGSFVDLHDIQIDGYSSGSGGTNV